MYCFKSFMMLLFFCAVHPAVAYAGMLNGLTKIAVGVFQLPLGVLQGTLTGPPVVGTLFGAVNGAVGTLALVGSGAAETVGSAVPVVKSLAPYLLAAF